MDGIVIEKISYNNYRQYGTGSLKFNNSNPYKLSIMIAKNGTGKTTFLNSITWCLYGKEYQLSDESKALPLLNTKILKETNDGEMKNVSVIIALRDSETYVEFKREIGFIISIDANGVKKPIPGSSELVVSKTKSNDFSNTEIISGPDAEMQVKKYFHDEIYDFYFFDGEQLKQFFAPGREKNIKRSIYNISQVSLLENVCDHVEKMLTNNARALGKESPDIDMLNKQKDEKTERRKTANESRESNREEIGRLKTEIASIDDKLQGYRPIKDLQIERSKLTEENDILEIDKESFYSDRSSFIRHYTILLKLYPRIKKILNYINDKESNGELPPTIDIDLVRQLLDHLNEECPLCGNKIGESGKEHLEGLLDQYSVSSQTSNYLNTIKGPLESATEEVLEYKSKKYDLTQRKIDIDEREKRITKRLNEISASLINYSNSGNEEINISQLETDRANKRNQISQANQIIGATTEQIKTIDKAIKNIDEEINKAQEKIEQCDELKQYREVLSMMKENYNYVLNNITGGMKTEIENTTREIFQSMNWKTQTFGKLEIEDDYAISVYDQNGLVMTGSLGATEQMALAYSFILAIHKASGRNCPLVIDSPIGRSSDDNREKIAEALLKISCNKQIIMLFTPDDYSAPVKKLYSGKADNKVLVMSSDEKFIEGVE